MAPTDHGGKVENIVEIRMIDRGEPITAVLFVEMERFIVSRLKERPTSFRMTGSGEWNDTVDSVYFVAVIQQSSHEMTSNEAGCSGDACLGHLRLSSLVRSAGDVTVVDLGVSSRRRRNSSFPGPSRTDRRKSVNGVLGTLENGVSTQEWKFELASALRSQLTLSLNQNNPKTS